MSDKEFINNLSTTYVDVRRLDAKKINLKGKNILDYIKESTPTVKHSQDTRETVTENDLWGQWVETLEDGTVIVHDDEINVPDVVFKWDERITSVKNNKVYIGDMLHANIQFEKLKSAGGMFYCSEQLSAFKADLSNLNNGDGMFGLCSNLTTFEEDLSNLTNGMQMFMSCGNLNTFTSNLSNLVNGEEMFVSTAISSFTQDLPKLINGAYMFDSCDKLSNFTSTLPTLYNGIYMFFSCLGLKTFNVDLSTLIGSESMFHGCTSLTSFTSDLSSLIAAGDMFNRCGLTSFTSDLSSLIAAGGMFTGCRLSPQSVMYIASSINDIPAKKQLYLDGIIPYADRTEGSTGFDKDWSYRYNMPGDDAGYVINSSAVGNITLGIDVVNDSATLEQQLQTFAEEATFTTWDELKQFFINKGWTVTFQYGGTVTNITLSEDEQFRGTPIYARLIEVTPVGEEYTEKEKASAEYCTEDGTKYYNIDWGHDVTHPDEFQYFGSLLEACGYYGVIPKKYLEEA